jgi:valyl-tRNA synthetase
MEMPSQYDFKEAEERIQHFWEKEKLYKFDINNGEKIFSIDTPPPTVSGKLHIGHVFSYTQTDIIARYRSMNGYNVLYPFGFDDNGLPTEMLTEKDNKIKGEFFEKEEFRNLCLKTSEKYSELYKALFQKLGFSVAWETTYRTISDTCRRISQRSFLDLYKKKLVYRKEMPTLWCTKCKTAFAQAEIEDINKAGVFNFIYFATENGEPFPIATTRPELLSSCVAIFVHPQNQKYKSIIGLNAIVPLFGHTVPIIADIKADPEKGTGIVMCCTFGDTTDIDWWREYKLPLRMSFNDDGTLNKLSGEFEGLDKNKARQVIILKLKEEGLLFDQKDIPADTRSVNTHERCGTEVEYFVKKQWFINVCDNIDKLVAQGKKINWYPKYMLNRYIHWVENLSWDWAISRQRFFGVSIPVWYCSKCGTVKLSEESQLPVDTVKTSPLTPCVCGANDFIGETDVLDTWATSSVTPQLNSKWGEKDEIKGIFPMSMRPQAHDIIRTWAFYTIVKSFYHFNEIPWQDAVISGHTVKKGSTSSNSDSATLSGKAYTRKSKISKSKDGDKFSPQKLIETYSADAIRYWTASGKLGTDIIFDENEVKETNRLLTKLWNASRFAFNFLQDYSPSNIPQLYIVDKWLLTKFNRLLKKYHSDFIQYEYYPARVELQNFFWHDFCDNYIEFVKHRFSDKDSSSANAARYTLYTVLLGVLKLFSPFIPHITEEIFSMYFKNIENIKSIHHTIMPAFGSIQEDEISYRAGEYMILLVSLVRGYKSKNQFSLMLPADKVIFNTSHANAQTGHLIVDDLKKILVSNEVIFEDKESAEVDWYTETAIFDGEITKTFVEMNPNAVAGSKISSRIKQLVTDAKKEQGLKSKSQVKKVSVICSMDLEELIKSQYEKILYTTKSESLNIVVSKKFSGENLSVSIDI